MPETATKSIRAEYSGASTPPTLTWISETHFHGLGCSRCAWLFRPTGPLMGSSLQEMKENYMQRCDQEFAKHVCNEHPTGAKTNVSINRSAPTSNAGRCDQDYGWT